MVGSARDSECMHGLTASDRADDLQLVAIMQSRVGELAARHDLAVAFDRQALASEAELVDQFCDAELWRIELPGIAVDGELDHESLPNLRFR